MAERGFVDHATGEIRQDEHGAEIPDSRGVEIPLGFKRPTLLADQVERLFRRSLAEHQANQVPESFAEAENLEIEEEFDEWSPYEVQEFNGLEVTAHDFIDGSERGVQRREAIKSAYLTAERNAERAEAFQAHIDNLFAEARKRGAGVSPAPSQGAKPPPAEPSSQPEKK